MKTALDTNITKLMKSIFIQRKYLLPNIFKQCMLSTNTNPSQSIKDDGNNQKTVNDESFISLLRNSPFIRLGDPKNKILIGNVTIVTKSDIYVDYGGKFNAIVKNSFKSEENIKINTKVYLLLNEHEKVANFGEKHWITLKEADAILLGVCKNQ
ncbi:28S ribosomal protein S28, mitochondrial-like [Octopus sinensis]|uniref:28S ribosomal protein S28, mitochondrial-like n=1 Tax=Octopus sinensis TaxID=2607531 RepID=A0A6P7U033_9MOLL|nr:28S ribosomal protein S28, mitochondrial-like [Octopus sinensis]